MKTLTVGTALVAAALLAAAPALAQAPKAQDPKANCQPSASPRGGVDGPRMKAPEKIEGQVTAVDPATGVISVRGKDGSTHEFKGNAETLKEYKAGDTIELTLRAEPPC
jgi:hypothetical protein